jgi:hypothetical protein
MLLMQAPVVVQIVGAPVACKEGVRDTWREAAHWLAGQLVAHFGETVRVEYRDLFDLNCLPLPTDVQLPVVFINEKVFSSGGKVNGPAIRRRIETLMQADED